MLKAFKQALAELEIKPEEISGLGYRPVGKISPLSQMQHD